MFGGNRWTNAGFTPSLARMVAVRNLARDATDTGSRRTALGRVSRSLPGMSRQGNTGGNIPGMVDGAIGESEMICEWPKQGENGCNWEAELKVGFNNPALCLCRVHAVAVVVKLLLESPIPSQ